MLGPAAGVAVPRCSAPASARLAGALAQHEGDRLEKHRHPHQIWL